MEAISVLINKLKLTIIPGYILSNVFRSHKKSLYLRLTSQPKDFVTTLYKQKSLLKNPPSLVI